ncbi:hypothetical protein PVK06_006864 [Gossypium arboreum]|uniref:Transmembrane protein n=1 Tax=Gossypium arboreum TaxID=29729 RepID=A0ABR0QFR0_GOSAR|nr:hypothetical protein PVK06_006864 [Gossypium arboreum]
MCVIGSIVSIWYNPPANFHTFCDCLSVKIAFGFGRLYALFWVGTYGGQLLLCGEPLLKRKQRKRKQTTVISYTCQLLILTCIGLALTGIRSKEKWVLLQ